MLGNGYALLEFGDAGNGVVGEGYGYGWITDCEGGGGTAALRLDIVRVSSCSDDAVVRFEGSGRVEVDDGVGGGDEADDELNDCRVCA